MTKDEIPQSVRDAARITGSIGGRIAASNMTAAERSERARKAAQKRWSKTA
jgi:hypothetical protein